MSGLTLKQLREHAEKSVAVIAKNLDITVQTLYRYENGSLNLPLEFIIPLANMYQESIENVVKAALLSISVGSSD